MGPTESVLGCKICSISVNSNKIIPSSPTPHLHWTIQAPNATEIINLCKALRYATSILSQLDNDISYVWVVLDELHLRCKPLCKFITEQNTILTHIHQLPAEILIEIFLLCIDYDIFSFSPKAPPLLIGQVCIGWQQVVLFTQKLWSYIAVTHCWSSSLLTKLCISQAISALLTIHFGFHTFCARQCR